nr:MAG TPA: hypothetical protein [Caudoviricetes sp.]
MLDQTIIDTTYKELLFMAERFIPLSEEDFKNDVSGIMKYIGKLKFGYNRKFVMTGTNFVDNFSEDFIRFLNAYLSRIESDANAAKSVLQSTECVKSSKNVFDHNFINEIIYGNYDYASVLQFVDGIEDGLESNEFAKVSDVENFFTHTIDMAFNHMGTSVGALVDQLTAPQVNGFEVACDHIDVSTMNTLKTSSKLFPARDRIEVYNSVSEVIRYLNRENDLFDKYDVRIKIAAINSICDYIAYTIVMYLARYYVIQKQIGFFAEADGVTTESTVISPIDEPVGTSLCPSMWTAQSMEEIVIKDYKKLDLVIDHLKTFAEKHHIAIDILKKEKENIENKIQSDDNYKNKKHLQIKFYKELADTAIGDIILTKYSPWSCDENNEYNVIDKYYHRLKDALYRNPQNQFESSRDIFLSIIKAKDSSSVSNSDFIDTMIVVLRFISYKINNFLSDASLGEQSKWRVHGRSAGDKGIRNRQAVMAAWIETFYEEVAFAFLQNLQVREVELLAKDQKTQRELDQMFNLDVPDMKSDWDKTQQQMLSVPSREDSWYQNTKLDFYGQPIHEAMMMYNEYVASLPKFMDDIYFKEVDENKPQEKEPALDRAVNKVTDSVSTIITKLKSIIQALWNRAQSFWAGKSFQMARKWVSENEQNLMALTFPENAKMDILPYKENITLPPGFQNAINNIAKFNQNHVRSKESLQQYLKTIYPTAEIANWFANDKNAEQRYLNLILFDNGSEGEKQKVSIGANEIKKNMSHWIATIKGSETTQNDFKKINDDVANSVNTLNATLVSITRNNSAKKTGSNEQQPGGDSEMLNMATTKITNAVNRLWAPITPAIIQAMMNQYNYIKTAYTLGNKSTTTSSSQGQTVTSDAGSGEL